MAQHKFEDALDECLDMLRAGVGIDACVAPYPEFAEELRAQLGTAQALLAPRPLMQPGPNAQALGRSLLLSAVAERRAIEPDPADQRPGRLAAFFAGARLGPASPVLSAFVALVVVGGAVVGVSAATTGNADPTAPLRNLVSNGAASEVELRGTVTAVGASDVTVQTTTAVETVLVTEATEIKGANGEDIALTDIQPGDIVKVHASRQDDGALVAREVEIERSAAVPPDEDQAPQGDDNSGPGSPNSGPGNGDDDEPEDNSGPGNTGDDDGQDDNSGPGNGDDDDDDSSGPGPNSGPGGGDDHAGDDGDDSSGNGPPGQPPAHAVEVEFDGTVTAVQGQQLTVADGSRVWVVVISASTDVRDGPVHVGDDVEVRGTRQGTGPVAAERVDVLDEGHGGGDDDDDD